MLKKIEKDKWLYDENGKKSGIKIRFKNFNQLMDKLEDLHDIYIAYQHKGKKLQTIPMKK